MKSRGETGSVGKCYATSGRALRTIVQTEWFWVLELVGRPIALSGARLKIKGEYVENREKTHHDSLWCRCSGR